uniref:Putative DNA binding, helix-turn-helix domain containing protein n=1 Tax=viral metagenome TaxID=1070528 RepID=A0A6H1Z7P0_9ZZZZ
MVTTDTKLLTTKEAAEILGVAKCTIYRWLNRGWLCSITLPNGNKRIPKVAVDKALSGR